MINKLMCMILLSLFVCVFVQTVSAQQNVKKGNIAEARRKRFLSYLMSGVGIITAAIIAVPILCTHFKCQA